MKTETDPEREQTLVTLAAPLLVWAGHFVFSYALAAIVCAKGVSLLALRGGIGVATVLALLLVARWGARGLIYHRAPGPADAAHDRRRFMGFVGALTAGLAGVAVFYSALVFVLVRDCR